MPFLCILDFVKLRHYLFYKPKKEGYDSMYPDDMRKFIRKIQYNKIKSKIKLKLK